MNKKYILETINSASQLITKMRKVEIIKSDDEIRLVNDLSDVLLNLTSPLTVTVIGPFNSGKSTFINAMIEERILPENINPSTSMVCKIGYCNSHLKIQYIEKGNILVKEIKSYIKSFPQILACYCGFKESLFQIMKLFQIMNH